MFENGLKISKKTIIAVSILVLIIVVFAAGNPVGYNEAGEREVVETPDGRVWVHFENGYYWKGFFSETTSYPNIVTVASRSRDKSSRGHEYATSIGKLTARFNDGSTAKCEILSRFELPSSEEGMIKIHKDYRSPEGLVEKGLRPFAGESLRGAAQLMSSEMHYAGGRSQMSQWFQDQLEHGLYLLDTKTDVKIDTLTGEEKTEYITSIRKLGGKPVRKKSALTTYGIIVTEALIADVDYEQKIDKLLEAKIQSQTEASVAKTQLVTAQQQQLTAEAKGKQKLVEIEYAEKQRQTKESVQAETRIILANKNKEQQQVDLEAARLEAQRIRELADAEAYKKKKVMLADGALKQKLSTYEKVQQMWAEAFMKYKGNIVPSTVMGSSGGTNNGALSFMEIMSAKAAMDLNLDLKNK